MRIEQPRNKRAATSERGCRAGPCHDRKAESEKAFTLIELVITMVILAGLTALAAPSLIELRQSYHHNALRNELATNLIKARSSAIRLGTRMIFSISVTGTEYSLGPDYIPYNNSLTPDTVEEEHKLPPGLSISPSRALIFDSRGFLVDKTNELITTSFTLNDSDRVFANCTVYPTGSVSFN